MKAPLHHQSPINHPKKITIAIALLCSSLSLVMPQTSAAAEPTSVNSTASRSYNIAAGSLADSLTSFAKQAGITLSFTPQQVQGLTSKGLSGNYTVEAGLSKLLANNDLVGKESKAGYLLVATPKQKTETLDVVNVSDSALNDSSYIRETTSVGSKIPTSIRETPRSISVVTRKRMDDEGFNTLQQAMEHTTGMRVVSFDAHRASFTSRGYNTSLLKDGVNTPATTTFSAAPNLAIYDGIEVLRGPAGLLQGAGEPGGSINLLRKRALKDFQFEALAEAGSWNHHRLETDVTGALTDSGNVRGRWVISAQEDDTFIDAHKSDDILMYGTIEVDFSPETTLSLGGIYQANDYGLYGGVPIVDSNGQRVKLPRHTNITGDWSRVDDISTEWFAELEHDFGADIQGKISARHNKRSREGIATQVRSVIDATTGDVNMRAYYSEYEGDEVSIDANLLLPFTLFGQSQQLVIGADYFLTEVDNQSSSFNFSMNAYNPDHSIAKPTFATLPAVRKTETKQTGVYLQANLKPGTEHVTVILGARLTSWNAVQTREGDTLYDRTINDEFSPNLGLVVDLTDTTSAYGSYSTIFQPQTRMTTDMKLIEPRVGHQFELGLKQEWLDGNLIGHAAIYQIDDKNRATRIDGCLGNDCFEAAGLIRSQGFEAEISGSPLENLQLVAGYAYTYAKYRDDPTNKGEAYNTNIPKNMFNLSAHYDIKGGKFDGMSLGAGVKMYSSFYVTSGEDTYTQGSYAVFNANVGYQFTEQFSAQFRVNNLFDKEYYERLSGGSRNNRWGEPRSVTLSLRSEF